MLAYTAAFFAFLKLSLTAPTSVKNTLLLISWHYPHTAFLATYCGNFPTTPKASPILAISTISIIPTPFPLHCSFTTTPQ
ncbi:hypothetical protein P692DRAFT_20760317 [Suillus brevipes Sb2]|nr:hypothetical protein P692DRAFT_20760317 [Suillus brevipes Sb2]